MSQTTSYPNARLAFQRLGRKLRARLDAVDTPSEVATVASTGSLVGQGFIIATCRKGPIRVVGVPQNTVVPGMRIFARRMDTNTWIYDGAAPAPNLGSASGLLPVASTSSVAAAYSSATGVYTSGGGTVPAIGWYWSFFFYVESLPSSTRTLLDWYLLSSGSPVGGMFQVQYSKDGELLVQIEQPSPYNLVYNAGVFAPHRVWFATVQIGNGVMVNGIPSSGDWHAVLGGTPYGAPTIGAAPAHGTVPTPPYLYGISLLNDESVGLGAGATAPPTGSWVSKVTFGCSAVSGMPVWPYPVVPASDALILDGQDTLGQGNTTYCRYLISDNTGTTLPNTATLANVTNPLTLTSTPLALGPY